MSWRATSRARLTRVPLSLPCVKSTKSLRVVEQLQISQSLLSARILYSHSFFTTSANLVWRVAPLRWPAEFLLEPRLQLPAFPRAPRARGLPALPGVPRAREFPAPERAFSAAFCLKQNLARLLLALCPHRSKFWHFCSDGTSMGLELWLILFIGTQLGLGG